MKHITTLLFLFVSQLTFAQPVHLEWAVGLRGENTSYGHEITVAKKEFSDRHHIVC